MPYLIVSYLVLSCLSSLILSCLVSSSLVLSCILTCREKDPSFSFMLHSSRASVQIVFRRFVLSSPATSSLSFSSFLSCLDLSCLVYSSLEVNLENRLTLCNHLQPLLDHMLYLNIFYVSLWEMFGWGGFLMPLFRTTSPPPPARPKKWIALCEHGFEKGRCKVMHDFSCRKVTFVVFFMTSRFVPYHNILIAMHMLSCTCFRHVMGRAVL